MKKRLLAAILVCIISATLLISCKKTPPEEPPEPDPTSEQTPESAVPPAPGPAITPAPDQPETDPDQPEPIRTQDNLGKVILATATSAKDSGLLDFLLPAFTAETGWEVDVFSVGAAAALQMGRDGDADVLLVNSQPDEDAFVADGFGDNRLNLMHNDFVIVGPKNGLIDHNNDVKGTFKTISEMNLGFVSRGDDSGAHKKEKSIWSALNVNPEDGPLYISIGQGMGITLGITRELNIYTLTDRATWLNFAEKGELELVCENEADMLNSYSVIPVSASVSEYVNTEGGQAFVNWITGTSGQELIGKYGVEKAGRQLFIPDVNN